MPREKVAVDQQEVVHVKYCHEGEGNHQKPHVFLHVHNGFAAARYEEGRPKTTLQAARWSQKPVCLDCRDVILLQI